MLHFFCLKWPWSYVTCQLQKTITPAIFLSCQLVVDFKTGCLFFPPLFATVRHRSLSFCFQLVIQVQPGDSFFLQLCFQEKTMSWPFSKLSRDCLRVRSECTPSLQPRHFLRRDKWMKTRRKAGVISPQTRRHTALEKHTQHCIKVKIRAQLRGFKLIGPVKHNQAFTKSWSPFLGLMLSVKLDGLRKILQFPCSLFRRLSGLTAGCVGKSKPADFGVSQESLCRQELVAVASGVSFQGQSSSRVKGGTAVRGESRG